MVEVAVIGAGAAGLVASRHLLRNGLRPCIFESRAATGGAWGAGAAVADNGAISSRQLQRQQLKRTATRPQMWDNLTPNLSRFTCCFSDFPWSEDAAAFPTLKEMQQYLQDYADRYVVNNPACKIQYGCTVTNVASSLEDVGDWASQSQQYTVQWVDSEGTSQSQDFDGVVVATGFFSSPVYPKALQDLMLSTPSASNGGGNIVHSANYRSPDSFVNQTVAVIGGSFSAHEISCDVRSRASRVVNVVGDHVPYVLPRFVPSSRHGGFMPIDYELFRRREDASRPSKETITMSEEECRKKHQFLRNLLGSRKEAQAETKGLNFAGCDQSLPPMFSISDNYLDLVIDDKIEIAFGRLTGAAADDVGKYSIALEDGSTIDDVDSIVVCTGYRSELGFLSPAIRETLLYDENDQFAPLSLCYDAFHPDLPGLGFVGMYRGPYFGGTELQARLVAGLLSEGNLPPKEIVADALRDSQTIRRHKPRAQFPHFDYIGMLDRLADVLSLVPDPSEFGEQGMMVAPPFFQPCHDLALKCKQELDDLPGKQSEYVARATLSALIGKYSYERTITQLSSKEAPQRVHGVIKYSVQEPNLDSLRYREDGFLDLPNGNSMEVFREYDYLYNKKDGALELYFVEFGKRAHLFLSLKFQKEEDGYWLATSDHLCIKDLYKGSFKIAFDGLGATDIIMTYRVKGPNKDYESVTRLTPIL